MQGNGRRAVRAGPEPDTSKEDPDGPGYGGGFAALSHVGVEDDAQGPAVGRNERTATGPPTARSETHADSRDLVNAPVPTAAALL